MRTPRLLLLATLAATGCVASPVDLAGKDCDAEGRCADGYECFHGRCLTREQRSGIECLPGESLPCGSDVGTCRKGVAACGADGRLGACEGGVGPAPELCDGKDNDCDGDVDDDYVDLCPKQDGVCKGAKPACANGLPSECGAPEYGADYEAQETRCDSLDNDCDGEPDEGMDRDRDRWGAAGVTCAAGSGDCDDDDPQVHPGAPERCNGLDDNCESHIDEGVDTDRDGYGRDGVNDCANQGVDCDDSDPAVHPSATELCNAVDDNCNARKDEALDEDQDGYGRVGVVGCAKTGVDCDDSSAAINPGAAELCNGVDDNCDSRRDEALDEDQDGYGRAGASGCRNAGVDCDDSTASVNPGAPELCNGVDDNCEGRKDEGLDEDQDGFGRAGATGCRNAGADCDDASASVNPGAVEACNGVDDNCDARRDEALDEDQDGYGRAGATGCRNAGVDCDDASASVNPGGAEACNGADDNCDGSKDEGLDDDGDGYGRSGATGCRNAGVDCDDARATVNPGAVEACNGRDDNCDVRIDEALDEDHDGYGRAGATGCPNAGTDCDDANAAVHPGAAESCNAADDDCDGQPDETFACVQDAVGGACTYTGAACAASSTVHCSSTCTPVCAAPVELCNGLDDSCDGSVDEGLGASGSTNVSGTSTVASQAPAVGGVTSGGFLVAWQESGQIKLARLRADGTRSGSTVTVATGASAAMPALSGSLISWLEAKGNSLRVGAAPLTLGATGVTAGTAVLVTGPNEDPLPAAPLALGVHGTGQAVAWVDKGTTPNRVYVQPLHATGAANGAKIVVGDGAEPAFAMDEGASPARAAVVVLSGGKAQARTVNAAATAYGSAEVLGTAVTHVAAAGAAMAWVDRSTTDNLYVRRLDAGRVQAQVGPALGTVSRLAMAQLGTAPVWMLVWTQPRAAGGSEVVAMRVNWTAAPSSWSAGTPVVLGVDPASSPAVATDALVAGFAFEQGTTPDVFLRVVCP